VENDVPAYLARHCPLILLQQAETEIGFLHKNDTFKVQITLNRLNPRLKLKYCLRFNPPHFPLLSTFKTSGPSCLFYAEGAAWALHDKRLFPGIWRPQQ
jgi:hypothetical protein